MFNSHLLGTGSGSGAAADTCVSVKGVEAAATKAIAAMDAAQRARPAEKERPTGWGIADPSDWMKFGSKHTGVIQFSYCDGSVRAIRKGANATQFHYAGAAADGFVVDWSQLGN